MELGVLCLNGAEQSQICKRSDKTLFSIFLVGDNIKYI